MKMSRFDLSNSRKFCMVCGDKALGYNFNAITCESCKAFFRRNALLSKKFTCPFNENCDITVVTRRFCQRCRLKKCFRVGMKKEHIMSEEDKLKKKVKIHQNRVKRSMTSTSSTTENYEEKLGTENWSQLEPFGDNQENIGLVTTSLCSTQTTSEIVDCLIECSENALQTISQLANTKEEIIELLMKICDSPTDALKLAKYFLGNPSGAINIIRKITNNSFDTFTFLMKLMSAPSETKEIMFKISSTPDALLDFLVKLLRSPKQIDDIINTFHNAPCEALSKINSMIKVNDMPEYSSNANTSDCSMISSMLDNSVQSPKANLSNEHTSTTNCIPSKTPATPVDQIPNPGIKLTMDADTNNVLEDIEDKFMQPNSIESVLCDAIKLEYETFRSLPQLIGDRELNEAERARLNELTLASKALYYPVDDDLSNLINDDERMKYEGGQQDPQLLKVINLTAVAIRRLIKMSKKISAFRNMCQEDQVALLKGGCTEMMIMRSVMTYDCDHATWKIPHSKEDMSNIKVDVLKLAKGNVYEEHERFIQTFEPKWRMDENIILIMCAILLFSPTRPRVIHPDVIKLEQNSYYYLLRRYLESVYPGCEAKLTFIKLIQKISEVERLNNVIIGVYLNVNPSKVEPLLREIFDLKNH